MAALLLGVSSLDTGTSVIFFLPESCPSGDGAYETIISVRVQVKGATILGPGTGRTEKAFAFTYCRWTAKLKSAPLFFFTPINYLKQAVQ